MVNTLTSTRKPIKHAAIRLAILCVLFYSISYLCRKSFDSNINEIMDFFGQGKASVGLIGTYFFVAYAVGQVFHGIMCKFYRPRPVLLTVGLMVSALSLLPGIIPVGAFDYIKYIWMLNGFACASFWSVIILTLNQCVAEEHKAKVMFVTCFPVSLGTFFSYASSSLFSFLRQFRFSFVLAAIAMALISIYWFVRSRPLMDACLAEKEEKDGAIATEITAGVEGKKYGGWPRSLIYLFICCAILAVVNNLVKDALNTWTPTILKDLYGMENWLSVLLSVAVPLMSVFGGVLSLALYRKCKDYLILSGGLYLIAGIILTVMVSLLGSGAWVVTLLCLMIASLSMTAINNLLTNVFPLNIDKGVNAGTVAGLMDGFCYIGSAISAYGIGVFAEQDSGWNGVCVLLIALSIGSAVASAIVIFLKNRKSKTVA